MGAVAGVAARSSPRVLSDRVLSNRSSGKSPRELCRQLAESGDGNRNVTTTLATSTWFDGEAYEAVSPSEAVPLLLRCLQRHASIVWLLLPAWVAVQACASALRPTLQKGYSNVALVAFAAVEVHHIYAEMHAWDLAKRLCLQKELVVMRQLGVLRKRRRLVPLGVMEVLDLYTDLVFPLLVYLCEPGITQQWIRLWKVVPVVGHVLARMISVLEFWRVAAFFVVAMLVTSLLHLWNLIEHDRTVQHLTSGQTVERVSADDFFFVARYGHTAMMPSVALLCEEMADQRRWVFDPSKDAAVRLQVHEEFKAGWADDDTALRHELMNQEEQDRQEHAAKAHFTFLLLLKVVVGNVVQIWLQGAFFSLSFNLIGAPAKTQVLCSIILSLVIALWRCKLAAGHLGMLGYVVMSLVALFAIFTGVRMYHTFACADHLWNLSTGCVRRAAS